MDKTELLNLITKINTKDEHFTVSTETTSWKAYREAETLTDPAIFPFLQEIIEEYGRGKKKEKREIRNAAYFFWSSDASVF